MDDRHHRRRSRRGPGVARDGRSRSRRPQALLLTVAPGACGQAPASALATEGLEVPNSHRRRPGLRHDPTRTRTTRGEPGTSSNSPSPNPETSRTGMILVPPRIPSTSTVRQNAPRSRYALCLPSRGPTFPVRAICTSCSWIHTGPRVVARAFSANPHPPAPACRLAQSGRSSRPHW